MIEIKRWALPEEFNATSQKQLLKYFAWKKYAVPLHRKTRKPTTDEEALEKILTEHPQDPLIPLAVDIRHLKKGLGDLRDAYLGKDGRFHSEFPFEPDTGRLSCVGIDAEILTEEGWLLYPQLRVGMKVVGYDLLTGHLKWTELEAVHIGCGDLGLMAFRNTYKAGHGKKPYGIRSTAEHKWVGFTPRIEGLIRGDKVNAHGILHLKLSASGIEGTSDISSQEAAIAGWALTDGHVKKLESGRYVLSVGLVKKQSIDHLKRDLTGLQYTRHKYLRTHTSTGEIEVFYLGTKIFDPIWRRVLAFGNFAKFVLALPLAAREAMWAAMMEADGSYRKHYGRDGGRFGALKAPAMEAFTTLATVLGHRITWNIRRTKNNFHDFHIHKSRNVRYALWKSVEKNVPVWCPQTACGTWIIKSDNQIAITGNSRRPNVQNVPQGRGGGVEGDVARLIRGTIVPDPGKVLLEFDWKAIEAVLTGWFANDLGYIRLSLLDSHGFFTSFLLHDKGKIEKPFYSDDPDLEGKLSWLKKNFPLERADGKKINLALGYGMGPRLLSRILKCSLSEAVRFIMIKDRMAPIVTRWKGQTQRQAHHDGYLENPFGYRRYFFSVFSKTKKGEWRLGEEANEALAFLPQSTAASMLRWTLVELGEGEEEGAFELLIPIHDAIILQCDPEREEGVTSFVKSVMEREWPELNGLSIGVSVKRTTKAWSEMEEKE